MMETGIRICYICQDKRRIAETNALQARISDESEEEDTLKDILLRAVAVGHGEEEEIEQNKSGEGAAENALEVSRFPSGGSKEDLYKKVESDTFIIICRRCESLLKDFELHERKAAATAKDIMMFLIKRQKNINKNESNSALAIIREGKTLADKQGVLTTHGSSSRPNPVKRKRERKRKELLDSSKKYNDIENYETKETDVNMEIAVEYIESNPGNRSSKRIERCREEGILSRWGDDKQESDGIPMENTEETSELMFEDTTYRGGERKPTSWKLMKTSQHLNKISDLQQQTIYKSQCPFCLQYYIPSSSCIHNCTAYKNQLRCQFCSMYFTSYIRLENHLEIVHRKQRELKCPEEGCHYTCISKPAFVLHKHTHHLSEPQNSESEENTWSNSNDSGPDNLQGSKFGKVCKIYVSNRGAGKESIYQNTDPDPDIRIIKGMEQISTDNFSYKNFDGKAVNDIWVTVDEGSNKKIHRRAVKEIWDTMNKEDGNNDLNETGETEKQFFKRLHKCKTCLKLFPSKAHLKEHEISHSNKQPYTCNQCNKGFKRKNAMSRHMRTIHPEGPNQVTCSCGKLFSSQVLMEKHQESSGSHRVFVCPKCGIFYKTQSSLVNHMLLHKEDSSKPCSDLWPFTCNLCGEKLSSKVSLNNHVSQTHSTQNFKCQLCTKTFKTKQFLSQHSSRKHKIGNQEFTCPVCSKVFLIAKDLRRHMQSHNPEGMHRCVVCHKKFKVYATLQSHMKTHSKGKPFDCVICLVPNATLDDLKNHFLSEHDVEVDDTFSENWNRKCPVCNQIFLRRTNLTAHVKTHFDHGNAHVILVENSYNESEVCVDGKARSDKVTNGSLGVSTKAIKNGSRHKNSTNTDLVVESRKHTHTQLTVDDYDKKTVLVKIDTSKGSSSNESFDQILEVDEKDIVVVSEVSEGSLSNATNLEVQNTQEEIVRTTEYLGDQSKLSPDIVEKSSTSNDEETKYICGQCSSVFIEVEDLKTHLLTCYQQETNDDYVFWVEVDENN